MICEGYTDVIGFARAGSLGRWPHGHRADRGPCPPAEAVHPAAGPGLHADDAGQAASDRVYAWERTHDIEVAVVALPPGSDPDELARTSPETLHAAVEGARPFLEFRVERVLGAADLGSAEGRAKAAEAALAVVAEHPDDLVRDQYVMTVADRCRIDPARLRERLEQLRRSPKKVAPPDQERGRRRQGRGSTSSGGSRGLGTRRRAVATGAAGVGHRRRGAAGGPLGCRCARAGA